MEKLGIFHVNQSSMCLKIEGEDRINNQQLPVLSF